MNDGATSKCIETFAIAKYAEGRDAAIFEFWSKWWRLRVVRWVLRICGVWPEPYVTTITIVETVRDKETGQVLSRQQREERSSDTDPPPDPAGELSHAPHERGP